MDLEQLAAILNNKLIALSNSKAQAIAAGELEQIYALDIEVVKQQKLVDEINSLVTAQRG